MFNIFKRANYINSSTSVQCVARGVCEYRHTTVCEGCNNNHGPKKDKNYFKTKSNNNLIVKDNIPVTIKIWLENLYLEEIKEVRGTIRNEHLLELGYTGKDPINPHTKNIEVLELYIKVLEGKLEQLR